MQVKTPDYEVPDDHLDDLPTEFYLPMEFYLPTEEISADTDKKVIAGTDPLQLCRAVTDKYLDKSPKMLRGSLAVQVAYNIADIEKLFAPYLNSVLCAMNRLNAGTVYGTSEVEETEETDESDEITKVDDFFGNFKLQYDYDTFFSESVDGETPAELEKRMKDREWVNKFFCNSRTTMFGSEFSEKAKDSEAYKRKVYSILWLISFMRHMTVHHDVDGGFLYLLEKPRKGATEFEQMKEKKWDAWFVKYCRSGYCKNETPPYTSCRRARDEAIKYLDEIYKRKLDRFNNEFLKNAKNNIGILASVLSIRDDDDNAYGELLGQYYRFCETKEHRNDGFSVKIIREKILEKYNGFIKSSLGDKMISERQKLNTILDMLIYRYYLEHKNEKEDLKKCLRVLSKRKGEKREGSPEEEQRMTVYEKKAEKIWEWKINPKTDSVLNSVVIKLQNPKTQYDLRKCAVEQFNKIKDESEPSRFSELLYLMTLFLDGKEINMMLTQMISKLDGIKDFYNTYKKLLKDGYLDEDQKFKFRDEYVFFSDSKKITKELSRINSFARMTGKKGKLDGVNAKKTAYIDATSLLGFDGTKDELSQYLDVKMLNPENNISYNEYKTGLSIPTEKHTTGFRNFICANVIDNAHFRYIVTKGNPVDLAKLAKNRELMRFVLRQLPETQLRRYANLCGTAFDSADKAVEDLSGIMSDMAPENFSAVQTHVKKTDVESTELEKKKSMVSLYLTILYLLVKNVNNVNARYISAFNQLDRDTILVKGRISTDPRMLTNVYCESAYDSLQYGAATKRFREYFKRDKAGILINIFCTDQIIAFRNYVEHLDVMHTLCCYASEIKNPTSYFAIYHYCMQIELFQKKKLSRDRKTEVDIFPNDRYSNYRYYPEKCHFYSKDAVKCFCFCFGYNLPRYKNLTTEALFDYDHPCIDQENRFPKKENNVPEFLYHVTSKSHLDAIRKEGLHIVTKSGALSPYLRSVGTADEKKAFIHLHKPSADGKFVPKPRKKEMETVVLQIYAKKMMNDGFAFYLEKDDSLLVESVPPKYITFPENTGNPLKQK